MFLAQDAFKHDISRRYAYPEKWRVREPFQSEESLGKFLSRHLPGGPKTIKIIEYTLLQTNIAHENLQNEDFHGLCKFHGG